MEEKERERERRGRGREGSERKLYTKCTCAVLPQVVRRNARSFRYYVMQRGKRVQGYGEDQLSTSLGCPGGAPLSLEFGTTLRDHRRKLRKKPSPPPPGYVQRLPPSAYQTFSLLLACLQFRLFIRRALILTLVYAVHDSRGIGVLMQKYILFIRYFI